MNAVWPGSSLHYCEMVENPRYEDFDIRYTEKANRFAFMGLGFTRNQSEENSDLSPYMNRGVLEKKFYSFQPSKEEDERTRSRNSKVNETKQRAG